MVPGTIKSHLHASVQAYAGRPALIDASTGAVVTYGALGERLAAFGERLAASQVQPGEVVMLAGGNSVDMAVALLGAMVYGAIANPVNPALADAEVRTIAEHAGARVLFADAEQAPAWPSLAERNVLRLPLRLGAGDLGRPASITEPTPEGGALLIYTSGTTGKPKGVLLRHRNIVANVATAIDRLGLTADHRTLVILPLFHTFAFISDLCSMLFCGGAAVVESIFDITRLKQLERSVRELGVRSFSAVPLMFELMMRFEIDLRTEALRFCVSGAAPLRPETVAAFHDRYGVPIIPAYGMTETTCFATISPPSAVVPGSCGVPAGCEVRVADDGGADVARGDIGELLVSGPSVIEGGYFRDDRPCYADPEGRWLRTGDLARQDERGYVFIVGRKKNMVIRGGEKVYLEDIDRILAGLSGVLDCASVGVSQDDVDRIVTFVVADPSRSLARAEIFSALRDAVGEAKCPDVVTFVESIPRTATNKVRLGELQRMARDFT